MSTYQPAGRGKLETGGGLEPFDLNINLGPDSIPWLSVASRAGSVHSIPRRSPSLPELPDILDLVYDYTAAIQYAELQPDPELSRVLGDLVFGDPMVLQLFQATRGVAADRGRPLLFRILASPHMAVLPWELLPDPAAAGEGSDYRYLALAPDTYLVRLARGRTYPTQTTTLEAPLNLLIVLSSPTPEQESEDRLTFDIYDVKRSLLTELSPLEKAGMLCIDVEDRPTLENLRCRIGAQRRGYHLFHYVGHALPDRLVLEDRTSRRKDVTSSQLVEVLQLCPDLRLAVFAGCETARPARAPESLDVRTATGWRDLLSLADCFVQEACPAVIGMQAVLPFSTERTFTRFFYQALANGYSTAESLRLARGAIRGDERLGSGLLDWSVPALFVGSTEPGALLQRTADVPKPEARLRSDLKLGFRQSEERFFARELPLRQVVEFLKGLTPGRVLVITGPTGVGKTALVDRALDELGEVIKLDDYDKAVTHVLYVHFKRLVPEVSRAWGRLDAGGIPDLSELVMLDPESMLERLCRLTTELLRQGEYEDSQDTHWRAAEWWDHVVNGPGRAQDAHVKAAEWWDRIVEDLVHHRLVLIIDQVCLLDRLQRGLLEGIIKNLLEANYKAELEAASKEKKEKWLENLEGQLAQLQDFGKRSENGPVSPDDWLSLLPKALQGELRQQLGDLPDRLLLESCQVYEGLLERQVVALSYEVALGEAVNGAEGVEPWPEGGSLDDLKEAVKKLEKVRTALGAALLVLAERRSPSRIVITAVDRPHDFLDLQEGLVFEMRLAHLSWPETWRWIRGSLPGLMRFGEQTLSELWPHLGGHSAHWVELEGRVLRNRDQSVDLLALATQIAPRRPVQSRSAAVQTARRGQRGLRIAVAGQNLAEADAIAESLNRLAIRHGIGGRYVTGADEAGALATLIDEPSPFGKKVYATWEDIVGWLKRVLVKQPDIVLLDYALVRPLEALKGTYEADPQGILLRSMHYISLLIAAGGHHNPEGPDTVTVPSAYPEILGVGPLDNDGGIRPYAEWHPQLLKPDLFMTDDLSQTELRKALKPNVLEFYGREKAWGSSFSALHAVATAALVWSILPDFPPRDIWELLVEASKPIDGSEPARSLTVEDAVALARQRAVEDALKAGTASFQTLGAITGIEARSLWSTIGSLIKDKKIIRLSSGRLERYQLL